VRTSTLRQMESLNMDRATPILIRIYKEERTLEVWKQDQTGKFALLKSFPICKFSGKLSLARINADGADGLAPPSSGALVIEGSRPWPRSQRSF
jgi:hypothetical protein